jgi:hypothetical protein
MSSANYTNTRHTFVILKLPPSVPALITHATGIVTRMTGNPSFPNPTPSLAVLTAAIENLKVAEAAALARTKGAVATRNDKRTALVLLLRQLRGHVQTVADASAENGAAVIASAGLAVRKAPAHRARAFVAKPGAVSGSAKLVATTAARRASYEWQYSTDGGKTWQLAPVTLQAKTVVTGLQPGSSVTFRYRSVTKTGEADWSQAITLVVR